MINYSLRTVRPRQGSGIPYRHPETGNAEHEMLGRRCTGWSSRGMFGRGRASFHSALYLPHTMNLEPGSRIPDPGSLNRKHGTPHTKDETPNSKQQVLGRRCTGWRSRGTCGRGGASFHPTLYLPYTMNLEPGTRNPQPGTRNPDPGSRISEPITRIPEPGSRKPQPETPNSKSSPAGVLGGDHAGRAGAVGRHSIPHLTHPTP